MVFDRCLIDAVHYLLHACTQKCRGGVMLFTAFVSFSALVLCIPSVVSISINENNVRNTPWVLADTTANGVDMDLFIGLSGVVVCM